MTTTEQLAAILHERHAKGLAKYGVTVDRDDLTPEEWAQHAIEEMLDGAAYLMRLKATLPEAIRRLEADNLELRERLAVALRQRDEALAKVPNVPEPGSMAAHHVEILRGRVKELEAELAEAKASLAKAPSVPASASEAPREGGDSGSSSFEALEAFLRADTCRSIQAIEDGRFIVLIPGYIGSPASRTLKGISASVEQMVKCESKWLLPISRPKREFGEGADRWRLEALERWLRSKEDVSIVSMENRCLALNETGLAVEWGWSLAALADKLAADEAKP